MKGMILALALAAAAGVPAFAQTVDAMTCADFAKQDHTQQMATVAAIQAFTKEKQAGQQLMSDEIFTQLSTKCTGHGDMMVMDAMK
ncbi:MAG: HdeA/HdeB family chaperone [Amaricoccus sp.]